MRLGDLDELKNEVQNICKTYTEMSANQLGYDILNLINNAPTVEPTYISDIPDDKVKDLQKLAIDYGEGIAVFERKRPQGEWILSSIQVVGENWYKCSICGRKLRTSRHNLKEYPFCHCGADMRKGGAE